MENLVNVSTKELHSKTIEVLERVLKSGLVFVFKDPTDPEKTNTIFNELEYVANNNVSIIVQRNRKFLQLVYIEKADLVFLGDNI